MAHSRLLKGLRGKEELIISKLDINVAIGSLHRLDYISRMEVVMDASPEFMKLLKAEG